MLEFEETQRNTGYVVLSTAEYRDLLKRADEAYNALRIVRHEYIESKPIEVTFDKRWLYELAMDKLTRTFYAEDLNNYTVAAHPDDLQVMPVTIGRVHAASVTTLPLKGGEVTGDTHD